MGKLTNNNTILNKFTFFVRLAVGWVGVLSFITLFTFPYLMEAVSGQIAFWIYSSVSFVGFLFIAIFVPETRGKTEDEIKLYFTSHKKVTEEADNPKDIQYLCPL